MDLVTRNELLATYTRSILRSAEFGPGEDGFGREGTFSVCKECGDGGPLCTACEWNSAQAAGIRESATEMLSLVA